MSVRQKTKLATVSIDNLQGRMAVLTYGPQ